MTNDQKTRRARPARKTATGAGRKTKQPQATKRKPAAGKGRGKGKAPGKGRGRGAAPKKKAPRKAPARVREAAAPAENPQAHALARKIARLVLDKKASDVVILDVRGIASYADYVVIASGESDRQVSAMAESVLEKVKEEDGQHPVGSEGLETGQWVLLDYGDVVAHLFYSEVRGHYDLEGLWADAPREAVA